MAVKKFHKSATAKKKVARVRRAKRSRMHIRNLQTKSPDLIRLTVSRSNNHISAQLLKYDALKAETTVIASATTKDKTIKSQCKHTGNAEAAKLVGKSIAEKAKLNNVQTVAFDRSGYIYHGRIAALADAAREGGLEF
ncbi:MAG: 50S ribosomal protein L18 [Legionellales bacterium]|nr:50S ribosomal protein L18 [Legionellales bacterium]|tara:strand:- start:646 stop:1059 length:414 start_codon:yes stop_codon:yes gene_type:complete